MQAVPDSELEGLRIAVVGGSSGIGAALVSLLRRRAAAMTRPFRAIKRRQYDRVDQADHQRDRGDEEERLQRYVHADEDAADERPDHRADAAGAEARADAP